MFALISKALFENKKIITKLTFDSGTFVLVDKGDSVESPIFVNVLCASSVCASSSASCLARFYHNLVQRKIQDHHNFDYLAFLGQSSRVITL